MIRYVYEWKSEIKQNKSRDGYHCKLHISGESTLNAERHMPCCIHACITQTSEPNASQSNIIRKEERSLQWLPPSFVTSFSLSTLSTSPWALPSPSTSFCITNPSSLLDFSVSNFTSPSLFGASKLTTPSSPSPSRPWTRYLLLARSSCIWCIRALGWDAFLVMWRRTLAKADIMQAEGGRLEL